MPKTLEEYMNDPEIIDEIRPLREIYAIRLKIYDEIKDMTIAERTAYFNEGSARFLARNNSNPSGEQKPISPLKEPMFLLSKDDS
jgi:hypothetical protein